MKKIICIIFSLILVFACVSCAFAETVTYVYDPNGNPINSSVGGLSDVTKITSTCFYDRTTKHYIFTTDNTPNSNIESTVFDGMLTTEPVQIIKGSASNVEVYRDGTVVPQEQYDNLKTPGEYVVRGGSSETEILSFTVASDLTGAVNMYRIPSMFYVTTASRDSENLPQTNVIDLSKDGLYHVVYKSNQIGVSYDLILEIDHTYPELEIFGVENGMANGPVTFGEQEYGSSLSVKRDGEPVTVTDKLKTAGEYVVKYSDAAGNISTYYFTMNVFLDAGAWIFVVLAVLVVCAAAGYMIYSRKNMRVR